MTRSLALRAVLVLTLLGAAVAAALASTPRLGLDLRGGTQIVLEAKDGPTAAANSGSTDRALEVLRRRVDALGVAEPTLSRSGERRIIVELPAVRDPREAADVIGRTAQLTVHPVLAPAEPAAGGAAGGGTTLPDEDGQPIRLGPAAMTGEGFADATATTDEYGVQWLVDLSLSGEGGRTWQRLTAGAACAAPGDPARRVAIVLDGRVISSPEVAQTVACGTGIAGGATQITGRFTQAEAKDLAALVKGGALPVPVEIIEQRTVGPSLGAEAITATWQAALIGIAATLVFLVVVYRLVGLLAALGLVVYGLFAYAVLVWLGATFTLPGLAGFVLAIGMAVDANVLAFERAREELARAEPPRREGGSPGRRLVRAATEGFRRAWTAIADSNVTTLLAAGLLFGLASGPVRGFGVTLTVGVLASMVSALVVVRLMVELALRSDRVGRHPALSGIAGTGRVRSWLTRRDPQVLRRSGAWLALSAVLVTVAVAGIAIRGLNLGVEFTGGRLIQYSASAPLDVDAARAAVSDAGFPRAVVQSADDGGVAVRTQELSDAEKARITGALSGVSGGVEVERDELIGPSLGAELRGKALIAVGVALAAQFVYLALRFRWAYGVSAVLAMTHDAVILVGTFAWLGKPVDGVFLAALLTVIGYSVNDTVVVFDRVRERRRERGAAESWRATVNGAVLSTVPRTVNTGLGALFVLLALAVLGGDSLRDFAIALLIGIVVGTWSSSFTAAPLLVAMRRWLPDGGAAGRPDGDADGDADGDRYGRAPGADGAARAGAGRAPAPVPDRRRWSADPYGRPDAGPDSSGARL